MQNYTKNTRQKRDWRVVWVGELCGWLILREILMVYTIFSDKVSLKSFGFVPMGQFIKVICFMLPILSA